VIRRRHRCYHGPRQAQPTSAALRQPATVRPEPRWSLSDKKQPQAASRGIPAETQTRTRHPSLVLPSLSPGSSGRRSAGVAAPVHMQKRSAPLQEVGGVDDRFAREPLVGADVGAREPLVANAVVSFGAVPTTKALAGARELSARCRFFAHSRQGRPVATRSGSRAGQRVDGARSVVKAIHNTDGRSLSGAEPAGPRGLSGSRGPTTHRGAAG
jgi:hypothetical protein